MKNDSVIKGWTQLCSDVNWVDYHGMWCKKAADGSFYVIQWTNLEDCCGKEAPHKYQCEVKRIDFKEISHKELSSAAKSNGWDLHFNYEGKLKSVQDPYGGDIIADDNNEAELMLCMVEVCIQYGLGAPLESFEGNVYPVRIRAAARRHAEECMKDAVKLDERLNRTVNGIGSTAREYGNGNLDAAFDRIRSSSSPSPSNKLILKLSTLASCRFSILVPEHYRADGSCRCNDAEHQKKMIAKWGYKAKDFT